VKIHQVEQSSPVQNPSPRQELRALTGLRGLAATAVALAHYQNTIPAYSGTPFMWHNAVDLFFCLSGFTLCYVYNRETFRFSSYLTARVARIYPLYLVCLIAAGALYVWPLVINPISYPAHTAVSDFALQLAMLNAWPVIGSGVHWDTPAWSLSVEWFCYLVLFPILLFQKASPSTSTRLLCIVVTTAASFFLFTFFYDDRLVLPQIHVAESPWSDWIALARGVLGFTAGWAAYASFQQQDGLYAGCTKFATWIWCGIALVVLLAYCRLINPHALIFAYPFAVLAATDPNSVMSRLLGSRPLHFLGVISYSIYMTHFVVFLGAVDLFGTPDTWPLAVFVMLAAATAAVSVGTYFAIEKPARNALRGIRRSAL
jgi:peptidoglycan/LPS O-acetylase OafA/YrhL